MNKGGIIGEILETGGSMAKKSGKTIVKTAGDAVKATTTQITGKDSAVSDKDIVKNLYGIKDDKKNLSTQNDSSSTQLPQDKLQDTSSLEDKKKLLEVRKKLHDEVYYDPLVSSKKPFKKEERPAEKTEKEKQEEMLQIQEKEKKKPPPLMIQKAQQRVEKFPGRAG